MTPLVLHDFHEQLQARFTEVKGMEVVKDYGDFLSEYSAVRHATGIIDLSFRGRLVLTGEDRIRLLNGQVTNDVKDLQVGHGCYAALITNKGRMESDLNIYVLADEILLDFEPGLTGVLSKRFNKFIIADDVQVVDVSAPYGLITVQGPTSHATLIASELGLPLPEIEFQSRSVKHETHGEIFIVNRRRVGLSGFDLFVPTVALQTVASKLNSAAIQVGGRPCGWDSLETIRIEAGIPRFGEEMNESNLPPETGIESRAISYTKGCYIGQEIMARIRTYGQVAKTLRGLRLDDDGAPILPAKGDKVHVGEKEVGLICSAIHSPTLNARLALAYIRREFNKTGTALTVKTSKGELGAKIVATPFVTEDF